jgi:hypothetical protein
MLKDWLAAFDFVFHLYAAVFGRTFQLSRPDQFAFTPQRDVGHSATTLSRK